jgi:DNA-binding NtrC family response regulator
VKVLIVDDNPAICTALELLFELHGLGTLVARGPDEALALVAREDVGAVVQDMNFRQDTTSGNEGAALMRAIRALDPDLPVLLMTAYTSLEMAVALVKEGANDYVAKPWDDEKLVTAVKGLLRLRQLAHDNLRLTARASRARRDLAETFDLGGLAYASGAMHEIVSLAARVAAADVPVLITGPNGAGKERLAEIVQRNSRRKAGPFVKVNAGGLPDQLLEAELFGAEAGAYTGATKARVGRFEEAHRGTLFLDEIGNLSTAGQMKLLRVLQTGEFQRLGSNATRTADVRLVSATNADLPEMIRRGAFREDLYFRLNVIELKLPPLRDRPEDALLLAETFLARVDPSLALSDAARRAIAEHEWPGNIRELDNRVQRAALVRQSAVVTPDDLGLGAHGPRHPPADPTRPPTASTPPPADAPPAPAAPSAAEASAERAELERAIAQANGVVSRAAAILGLSRQALYRRMDRLGVSLERKVKA